jgi:hypothetical protein
MKILEETTIGEYVMSLTEEDGVYTVEALFTGEVIETGVYESEEEAREVYANLVARISKREEE